MDVCSRMQRIIDSIDYRFHLKNLDFFKDFFKDFKILGSMEKLRNFYVQTKF